MRRTLPLLLLLAACGDGGTEGYPRLLPLEQVLAEPALPPHAAADPAAVNAELAAARARTQAAAAAAAGAPLTDAALLARAAALRARARALAAQPVIEPALRDRMDRALRAG